MVAAPALSKVRRENFIGLDSSFSSFSSGSSASSRSSDRKGQYAEIQKPYLEIDRFDGL
jgi:hypothetical protein